MAVTIVAGLDSGLKVIRDSDADATPENNVMGRDCTIFTVTVDNTANAAVCYLKLYNAATAVVGTTAPDQSFPMAASSWNIFRLPSGIYFNIGLSFACVTDGGGTAGTTNPGSDVSVTIEAQEGEV